MEELPQPSVARYVRFTVNLLRQVWLTVTSPTCVITAPPPQLSLAFKLPMLAAGTCPEQLTLTLAGQVITGGVISSVQLNTCAQVAVFPQPSVAV